ncbi:MAG: type III secretion chaperone [Chlamydiota bacterium]
MDWKKLLHWSKEELDDLRFVGYSYVKEGNYEIALTIFQALVVISPKNTYDLQTMGALYLETGNNLEALHYLDRALALHQDHYPSLLNRAKALYALGYKQQAYVQSKALEACKDPYIAKKAVALAMSCS